MKEHVLLFIFLWLSVMSCLAQEKQDVADDPDRSSIRWFEEAANDDRDGLLFKSLEYTAPYSRMYFELRLDAEGNAFTARVIPGWAVQNSRYGKLSAEQIKEVKQMLEANYLQVSPSPTEAREGEKCTAIVFVSSKGYARYNFGGFLPVEVQRVVDFVNAEIEKQEKLRYEEWLEEQKKQTESPPQLERWR